MNINEKKYLGDGVYVRWDGYHIILTTENGIEVENTIFLDRRVMQSLINYNEDLISSMKNE